MFGRLSTTLGRHRQSCKRYLHGTKILNANAKSAVKSPQISPHVFRSLSSGQKLEFKAPLSTVRYQSTKSSDKSAKDRIQDLINDSGKRVFVFMKGVPEQPACGYSNAVIQILNAYEVDYDSFNVLEDDEIRQEIKAYSNWPTIPQVYVDKNFVGGCDIMIQMHQTNELEKLFESPKAST